MGKKVNFKSEFPCCACGESREDYVFEHHVYTRKAYPEYSDKKFNLMPLCLRCHVEIHKIGTSSMADKFYSVKKWLEDNGWEICETKRTWIFDKSKIV